MVAAITDPENVALEQQVDIECQARDDEPLLVDWLNAIIHEIATGRMIFGRFHVNIEDGRLTGTAWGEALDIDKHQPAAEVKGATQTHLRVAQRPNSDWVAQCVIAL